MIQLDWQNRQPIYEQLIFKLSQMVSLGVFAPDEQLPSVRSLARDLGVNPNTVQKAYQELERKGIIYSVAGKGSFIASGNNAAEILLSQNIEKIREALKEGKRSGLTRLQAEEIVEWVYKEETAL